MARSDHGEYRTQVFTSDGRLWSTDVAAEELASWLDAADSDVQPEGYRSTIKVRGPLYGEGWRPREWVVPLWAIVAISERP